MATPARRDEFRLQIADGDDVDGVMAVMESAFSAVFGEAWTRSQLVGILPMAGVSLVVARPSSGGTIAGFSLARTVTDEAELLLIAVRPEAQRRGVGSLLLAAFVNSSIDAGLRRIHLEVRDGNPASSIYIAKQFKPVGRRRDYYRGTDGSQHDAITLVREL